MDINEENKELKLSEKIKSSQMENEMENFYDEFGEEIKLLKEGLVEIMYEVAEEGEEEFEFTTLSLSHAVYQYIRKWLIDEGFKLTEQKEYKSDELKNIVTSIKVSWATVKPNTSGIYYKDTHAPYWDACVASAVNDYAITDKTGYGLRGLVSTTDCSIGNVSSCVDTISQNNGKVTTLSSSLSDITATAALAE